MDNANYAVDFLQALALTLAVEVPLLFVGARYLLKLPGSKLRNSTLLWGGILASSLTLPYLWFVLPELISNYTFFLIVGECLVFSIEGLLYGLLLKLKLKKALALSLFCNALSFLVGKLVT